MYLDKSSFFCLENQFDSVAHLYMKHQCIFARLQGISSLEHLTLVLNRGAGTPTRGFALVRETSAAINNKEGGNFAIDSIVPGSASLGPSFEA